MLSILLLGLSSLALAQCPDYSDYSKAPHAPFTEGRFRLPYMRPDPACRTFNSSIVEASIVRVSQDINDPDLKRLFQNTYPNTLDTAIKWKGYASNTDEEMQSYLPLLQASSSPNTIASLYRGVINLQARYLLTSPYCNSFQPPVESGIAPAVNGASSSDVVQPPYNNQSVFECKYELDSLAAFLEVSTNYYTATQDSAFFGKYQWLAAVHAVLDVANAMMTPTYAANGSVNTSPYTFTRQTNRASETLENNGLGNPVQSGTGLIRSAFRPSDDATIYQLFIPANMMFSRYLDSAADIVASLANESLAQDMRTMASSLRVAITKWGIVNAGDCGQVYAYEVDGYHSQNIMDDANIPSLLAAPFFGYLNQNDTIYQQTRELILSAADPYYMRGPVLNAVGGPHDGPGYAWPMASIVRILTTDDDTEITNELQQLVSSTDGLGLIHESINTFNASDWTRQWFSWANGLFGQMILDLDDRKPHILRQSFQAGAGSARH
ncbi:hypothetical protein AMS68_006054 [Peltaster fructicola]|uniref:Glycoside hydrolase family 125 protein n=1 Tax=Peltaster fructicola TaxID=286661 RepID=A0A6H0Y0K6_9PEZI|nr:hypothetical protein AMS68_006054 [Peltaster fructicola]